MDIPRVVEELVPGADYNPACFNFTEAEARDMMLWRDAAAMPTQAQLDAKWTELQSTITAETAAKQAKDDARALFSGMSPLPANATLSDVIDAFNTALTAFK